MSKPVKMTALWVENYRKRGLSPSDTESGLRLYVAKSGRKSWVRFYRHPISRKLVKMTLPYMGLAEARKRVADDRYLESQGIDPVQHGRDKRQAALDAAEGTLNAIAKKYLDLEASKLRSHDYYQSTLRLHVLPKLGERPIDQIKRSEITAVLDGVEQRSGPSAADAAQRVLSTVMNWHRSRSDFVSPMVGMKSRHKRSEHARTRVLSDDEIKRVWLAAGNEQIGGFGRVLRFMMLTGARPSEAAGLARSEIEDVRDNGDQFTVWRLPARRSKTKKEVVRPLSRAALDLIADAPVISDCDFVFSFDGRRPLTLRNDHAKAKLAELSGVQEQWRPHDLRRVFRSLCSRMRVPFEVSEKLLGHAVPLLVRTYDQHSHLGAMQEAVEKVAAEIERIVEGEKKGKVVRLR
jgi:integrase